MACPATRRIVAWLVFIVVVAAPAVGEDEAEDWSPTASEGMPEKWDWVQMTSGEWLKGELLVMYKDEMTFDSDEFDELSLDWRDIHEVRTAGKVVLGLSGRRTAVGQLFVQGQTVTLLGEEEQTFGKDEVVSITSGAPREINFWDFEISIGANYRTGNTEQTETTSRARLRRRTVSKRLVFDWLAAYNITDGVVAADSQRASVTWDVFLSRRFFWTPVFAEWYSDPFQNIADKYALAVAVGFKIIDRRSTEWEVSGGPGYAFTRFDDVAEDEPEDDTDPTFNIGTFFEQELTRRIDFTFEYRATFTSQSSGSYLHHMVTTIETELTRRLDFDITWVWDRIQDPRANADGTVPEQDDQRLALMLGFNF